MTDSKIKYRILKEKKSHKMSQETNIDSVFSWFRRFGIFSVKYNRLEKRFGADLIVVSADDPTDIGGVVGCYIISVPVMSGMQYICSSDSTSVSLTTSGCGPGVQLFSSQPDTSRKGQQHSGDCSYTT